MLFWLPFFSVGASHLSLLSLPAHKKVGVQGVLLGNSFNSFECPSGASGPVDCPSGASGPAECPSGASGPAECPSGASGPAECPSGASGPVDCPSGASAPAEYSIGGSGPAECPSGISASPQLSTPWQQERAGETLRVQGLATAAPLQLQYCKTAVLQFMCVCVLSHRLEKGDPY